MHKKEFCEKAQSEAKAKEGQKKSKTKPKAKANGKKPEREMIGRLEIPTADPYYMISSEVAEEIGRILTLVDEEGAIENVAVIGPRGSGKTSLAKQIAAMRKSPYHSASAYLQRSSDEWFGSETISLAEGMVYNKSMFVEALETPGATVAIQDLLLMQNKSVQNGLNDLLDPSMRSVWVDAIARALGRPIRVAPNVLIIATWNAGSSYTGNITLAANIMDRFPNRIMMDYPPEEAQVAILMRKTSADYNTALRICQFSSRLRQLEEPIEVSIRSLLQIAKKVELGAHIKDAMMFTIIASEEPRVQTKMLATLETIYTPEEKQEERTRKVVWEAWEDGGEDMVKDPEVAKAKAGKMTRDVEWDQAEEGGQFASNPTRGNAK